MDKASVPSAAGFFAPPEVKREEESAAARESRNPLGALLSGHGGDMLLLAMAYMLFDSRADSDLLLALLYVIMG